MVVKDIEKKIRAAGKYMKVWREIYNESCRSCQIGMVQSSRNPRRHGSHAAFNSMDEFMKKKFCEKCRAKANEIIENASN